MRPGNTIMINMKRGKMQVHLCKEEKVKCITAIVCHCNRTARDPSVLPEKKCTSSGSRRPCTKLWAICPPSLCAQVLTLTIIGRGSFPSLKMVCQPTFGREEDATLDPTCAVVQASPTGSRMTIPSNTQGGGVFGGASPEPLGGWSVMRCLFREGVREVGEV